VSDNFDDIYKQLASSLRKCVEIARKKVLLPGFLLSLLETWICPAFIDASCLCYALFFLLLVTWVQLPQHFIDDWLLCSQIRLTKLTNKPFVGFPAI